MNKTIQIVKDGKKVNLDIVTGEIFEGDDMNQLKKALNQEVAELNTSVIAANEQIAKKTKAMPKFERAVNDIGACLLAQLQGNEHLFYFEAAKLVDLPLDFTYSNAVDLSFAIGRLARVAQYTIAQPLHDQIATLRHNLADVISQKGLIEGNAKTALAERDNTNASLSLNITRLNKAIDDLHLQHNNTEHHLEGEIADRDAKIDAQRVQIDGFVQQLSANGFRFASFDDLIKRLNTQIEQLKKDASDCPQLKAENTELTSKIWQCNHDITKWRKNSLELTTGLQERLDKAITVANEHAAERDALKKEVAQLRSIMKWALKIGGVFATGVGMTVVERCFGMFAAIFG